jgi:hypothetical protein
MDLGRERAPALRHAAAALRALALLTFAGLVASVALASPARAASASVDGSSLRIAAGPGEPNALTISAAAPASLTVTDAGAPLTPGPGCAQTDVGVTCVAPADSTIDVSAGDLDDSVTISTSVGAFVDGGSGNDVIQLPPGVSDTAWCGRGRDWVSGEVLDFLDLACERVHYGRAGAVGRVVSLTGGGRWVPIPGQTWARVDQRILPGVLYLIRRYHVRITEGYGTVGHVPFGEHPLGLAVDIEPGAGGTWDDVSRLARWAEPRQNRPRAPFRWVGWKGDFNHGHPSACKPRLGCAPHLHLSWWHTPAPPRHPARTVRVFEVR